MTPIDPEAQISTHFKYREALWLPQWNRLANESDGLNDDVLNNLKSLFFKMDLVRNYFGQPIHVHVAYRPTAYNKLIGGAKDSPHVTGDACDFDVANISCHDAISKILEDRMLSMWSMRMEQNTIDWLHLDCRIVPPGGQRFFMP